MVIASAADRIIYVHVFQKILKKKELTGTSVSSFHIPHYPLATKSRCDKNGFKFLFYPHQFGLFKSSSATIL
jgi:hypothetical protein